METMKIICLLFYHNLVTDNHHSWPLLNHHAVQIISEAATQLVPPYGMNLPMQQYFQSNVIYSERIEKQPNVRLQTF